MKYVTNRFTFLSNRSKHSARPNLAEAARLIANRDDLDGDVGRLVDTKNLIRIEVGLLGRPTRECDALAHRVAQTEYHSRFDRSFGE